MTCRGAIASGTLAALTRRNHPDEDRDRCGRADGAVITNLATTDPHRPTDTCGGRSLRRRQPEQARLAAHSAAAVAGRELLEGQHVDAPARQLPGGHAADRAGPDDADLRRPSCFRSFSRPLSVNWHRMVGPPQFLWTCTSSPSTCSRWLMQRSSVDLPQPLGPMMHHTSPESTSGRCRPAHPPTEPNDLRTSLSSTGRVLTRRSRPAEPFDVAPRHGEHRCHREIPQRCDDEQLQSAGSGAEEGHAHSRWLHRTIPAGGCGPARREADSVWPQPPVRVIAPAGDRKTCARTQVAFVDGTVSIRA